MPNTPHTRIPNPAVRTTKRTTTMTLTLSMRRTILRVHVVVLTLFSFALTLCFTPARGAAARATPTPDFAAIDAFVESERQALRIPGLALGIVQGDRIVHLKGFGSADPSGRAVTPQTPFQIGSNAKSMTAMAIMQLVEAGTIDLDLPVQRYLPGSGLRMPLPRQDYRAPPAVPHERPPVIGRHPVRPDRRHTTRRAGGSGYVRCAPCSSAGLSARRTSIATPATWSSGCSFRRSAVSRTRTTCTSMSSRRSRCGRPLRIGRRLAATARRPATASGSAPRCPASSA